MQPDNDTAFPDSTVLSVEDVSSTYGSVVVLRDVNLHVGPGEIVGVLGRNGAGKTTLLKSIMGIVRPRQGRIVLGGRGDIAGMSSDAIAHCGIGYVPQGRAIFPSLTVLENLQVAQYAQGIKGDALDVLIDLFPAIKPHLGSRGGSLSGGQQQIVALARALVGSPRVLLLDEPSEGIQPSLLDTIIEVLTTLMSKRALSILLVEQNLDFAGALSHRAYVMDMGRIARTLNRTELLAVDQLARELMTTA
jgi:ABC-type branched-subunit amino acid transport system ATPase component